MSKPTAISPTQLFAMIILFEFGTALVLPIGMAPGPNVWLSILLAMPGGILLYLLLAYFAKQYPSLNLSGYIQKIVGVYIGWPVSLFFILIFIYISARNLREAGDLLITSSYDQTPIAVIHAAMIIPVIHALEVAVVGADVYTRATFPLFTVISTVQTAEFLQRLDAIVILALIIGVFFKMTMYAYAAAAIAADIFRFAEQRSLAYPIGAVTLIVSIMSALSYPEHSTEGSRHLPTLHLFLLVILPVLLLTIHLIRKRISRNRPA